MEVTVHVNTGETLTVGIRSGNMKSDGTVTTTADGTGWFKVDNFQIELIEDDETAINGLTPNPSLVERGAIYDLSGRKVANGFGEKNNSQQLPMGMYFVKGRKIYIR